ncbi:15901_t:CDS:2 [Acaulospora colombiana]|uniref:15901_t:CDS:1 n=1 Tax=Acaulospora colombiana TaxID=27376 RepID=A0ACA9JVX5_9GLOM|nr:15901_t:CDS:2 [Acaulospora colombiana]
MESGSESNLEGQATVTEDSANANFSVQRNQSVNSIDRISLSINERLNDNFSMIARISTQNSEAVMSFNDPPPSFAESQKQHRLYQDMQFRKGTKGTNNIDTLNVILKTTSTPSRTPNLSNAWEFAGWGSTYYIELPTDKPPENKDRTLLGQWRATSISGNDLVASVLYTVGICTVVAGKYAPLSLFIVSVILYPFQGILSEVGTALPLNGGSYNCLLNTSSKWFAAVAAALGLLDYVATAVVSAAAATSYLSGQFSLSSSVVFWITIGVLVLTAGVVALGLKESSNLAFAIFLFHCFTLTLLMVASVVRWIIQGNAVLIENWQDPGSGNPAWDIFYGTCIGLLGITGFETSANYIEDQKPGVYQKTVRNMWMLAFFFNAPISLLALAIMPMSTFKEHQNDIISTMGKYAVGSWLQTLVIIDAIVVLGAGVLTGFIGATGLIYRMASDHILPNDLGLCFRANKYFHDKEFFGVLEFTAPEVLQGNNHTKESDVYSFGVLTLEVFTRSIIIPKVVSETRIKAQPVIPNNLPPPIFNLIIKCLNTNPENRIRLDGICNLLSELWANLWYQVDNKQFETYDNMQYCTLDARKLKSKRLHTNNEGDNDHEEEVKILAISEVPNIDSSGTDVECFLKVDTNHM